MGYPAERTKKSLSVARTVATTTRRPTIRGTSREQQLEDAAGSMANETTRLGVVARRVLRSGSLQRAMEMGKWHACGTLRARSRHAWWHGRGTVECVAWWPPYVNRRELERALDRARKVMGPAE